MQIGECGLLNAGNTCYVNAAVQAMRVIPGLNMALEGSELAERMGLSGLLRAMNASNGAPVSPDKFLRQIFSPASEWTRRHGAEKHKQQCLLEFLAFLVENIADLKTCVDFEIDRAPSSFLHVGIQEKKPLSACVQQEFDQKLGSFGAVLFLSLTRFDRKYRKVHTPVVLETSMQLRDVRRGTTEMFYLRSIVRHDGNGKSGHYTTIVGTGHEKDQWLHFNDSRKPEKMAWKRVMQVAANDCCLLMFERDDGEVEPVSGGTAKPVAKGSRMPGVPRAAKPVAKVPRTLNGKEAMAARAAKPVVKDVIVVKESDDEDDEDDQNDKARMPDPAVVGKKRTLFQAFGSVMKGALFKLGSVATKAVAGLALGVLQQMYKKKSIAASVSDEKEPLYEPYFNQFEPI